MTDRDSIRLAVIINVKALGTDYIPESFDWLEFPKAQLRELIYLAIEIFWQE